MTVKSCWDNIFDVSNNDHERCRNLELKNELLSICDNFNRWLHSDTNTLRKQNELLEKIIEDAKKVKYDD